jgi:hypothetical protein
MNENWPQQERFCQRVREFAEAHEGCIGKKGGLQLDKLAQLLDTPEGTLKQWVHHKDRIRPNYPNLKKLADKMGVNIMEFIDAPAVPAPGVDETLWAKASEMERVINSMMFARMRASDLTDAQKWDLFKIWDSTLDAANRIKPQDK